MFDNTWGILIAMAIIMMLHTRVLRRMWPEEALTPVKRVFIQVRDQLAEICNQIRPYLNKIKKARKWLADILSPIEMVSKFLNAELLLLRMSSMSLGGMGGSRYQAGLVAKAEKLARILAEVLNPVLVILDKVLGILLAIMKPLNLILDVCGQLMKLVKPILELMKPLNEMGGKIEDVSRVLNTRIKILFVSASLKDFLTGKVSVPGMFLLEEIAKPMLEGVLSDLGKSKIPGIKFILVIPEMGMTVVGGLGDSDNMMKEIMGFVEQKLLGEHNPQSTFTPTDGGLAAT